MKPQELLSLSQAAAHLGVHPTTLRRWADAGHLQAYTTPGGHRRFRHEDLDAFQEKRKRLKVIGGLEGIWAGRALQEARQVLSPGPNRPAWLTEYDDQARQFYRQLGRRLVGVTMQYIASGHGGEDLLDEARQIGLAYASNFQDRGEDLPQALHKLFFFRDSMLEASLHMPEAAHLRPEANQHLFRRLQDIFNSVELAIVEAYGPAPSLPLGQE